MRGQKNLVEFFTEIAGWFQIFVSPFLIGVASGLIIWVSLANKAGLVIAILLGMSGFVTGILWANRVWKRKGTINFISQKEATPEFDKSDE